MSNSALIEYTKISPHSAVRTSPILKITPHHAAVVNATLEGMGNGFSGSRKASANYGIDSNGRIALYVDEGRRAATSSNIENDDMAVTIEIANCSGKPDWKISDAALESLIKLSVDICQRNGIEQLNFTGDSSGNLTMHKMFVATGCPGPYLASKFPWIAEEVNRRLQKAVEPEQQTVYRFQLGAFSSKEAAENMRQDLLQAAQKIVDALENGFISEGVINK